jgi:D-beta-D-heptose 7-phosphate kinase/D-beta-D-heptose 1-phosphate adenosyltransferase
MFILLIFMFFNLDAAFTVLVIGDVMLDTYHHCETFRRAPEADIPVYNVKKTVHKLGGAANVAKNLKNLECNVFMVSVVGPDRPGEEIQRLLIKNKIYSTLFTDPSRKTTNKIRILHENKLVNRHDIEKVSNIKKKYEIYIMEFISKFCEQSSLDAIVISDYAKGVITAKLCKTIIDYANENNIRTFVDPKVNNIHKYRNCYLFKPNWHEAKAMTGPLWLRAKADRSSIDLIFEYLKEEINSKSTVITCGKDGMYFDGKRNHVCVSQDKPVVDVTGSGDIVLAVLVYSLLMNNSLHMSCYLAHIIATKGVGTVGNYEISLKDITDTIQRYNTIYGMSHVGGLNHRRFEMGHEVSQISNFEVDLSEDVTGQVPLQIFKGINAKIIKDTDTVKISKIGLMADVVFTNGCFDIIHSAHIKLLNYAKSLGKILVVGLNSDASIRQLKGPERPINNETERCELLANLGMVDHVILFDEDTPYTILSYLRPKIMVKGGDYEKDQVIGSEFAQQVALFNYIENTSTTNMIQKIKATVLAKN